MEFFKYYFDQDMLPDYNPETQNSNGFANYLITSQGGSIDSVPFTAYGANRPFTPIQPGSPGCHCD